MELDSDIRSTPQWLFEKWNAIFRFDTDVCANKKNHKCEKYFTYEQNGLVQSWGSVNWMNPPYSKGSLDKWLKKATEQQLEGKTTVALVPGDTSTKWYQENILDAKSVTVVPLRKRIKFGDIESGAKFASHIVIYWGSPL
jgi:phage N-6-adenine-methyltransferase